MITDEERKRKNREIQKRYRENSKNKEIIKERGKIQRSKLGYQTKKNAYQRTYRADPKNKTKEKREIYRSKPDVKQNEKVVTSTRNRIYAEKNKESRRKRAKERNEKLDVKGREEKNTKHNVTRNKRYQTIKNSLYKILGGQRCSNCEYDENPKALDIDHIHNTGNLDRKRFKGKRKDVFYAYYVKHPIEAIDNLQVLCSCCNQIKNIGKQSTKYRKLKKILCDILGGQRCVKCGYDDNQNGLQFDHIYNDGNQEKFSGDSFHKHYIENPDEAVKTLQVLCANCNQIKART